MAKSSSSSSSVPRAHYTSLLLVLVLILPIVSPVAVAAAAEDDGEERAISVRSFERLREIIGGLPDRFEKVLEMFFPPEENGEERSAAGRGRTSTSGGAVGVVGAGGKNFSVVVVDVTSAVTWTSRCGGGGGCQRRVQCGDPLCKQYGGGGGGGKHPSCGGETQACKAGNDALLQGNVSLSTSAGRRVFSGEDTVYACRAGENSGDFAIVGLARGSVIANSSKTFSYLVDSNLRSSVWLGDDAAAAPATGGGRKRSTTQLVSPDPDMDPSFYYVNITGINVGDGSVSEKKSAATTAILTTTMPFTFLSSALFDHLKQELPTTTTAAASGGGGSDSDLDASFEQLCYPKETKLPAEITLAFAGKDAAMKLEQEHYSYKKSNGVVCLSILRSPLPRGVSIVGSMLQAGRRMTYNLHDDTLTFDLQASSSRPSPSPSSSSSSSRSLSRSSSAPPHAAVAPVLLISSAWLSLLLAMIM